MKTRKRQMEILVAVARKATKGVPALEAELDRAKRCEDWEECCYDNAVDPSATHFDWLA